MKTLNLIRRLLFYFFLSILIVLALHVLVFLIFALLNNGHIFIPNSPSVYIPARIIFGILTLGTYIFFLKTRVFKKTR